MKRLLTNSLVLQHSLEYKYLIPTIKTHGYSCCKKYAIFLDFCVELFPLVFFCSFICGGQVRPLRSGAIEEL